MSINEDPGRRNFISKSMLAIGGMVIAPQIRLDASSRLQELPPMGGKSAASWARDESFWREVRLAYRVSPGIINLNNGGVSPSPAVVQEAVDRYMDQSNEAPSYYMWRILDQGREPLRKRLAKLGGVSPEEIAIQRNSSEALETIIFGLRLREGDEVVLSKQDYPNMINAWKQREERDGIVLRWVDHQLPADHRELKDAYLEQFSERTKVVHLTQVINWTGQILPCGAIAEAAHQQGIEVVVDGAHAFAHLPEDIPATGADYYGTSLHKWLCAPIGTGMLYVKKSKIGPLYPLLAAPDPASDDIRKFEALGTRSFPLEQAIGQAMDVHQWIGPERKFQRLHYLKRYWLDSALELGYRSYTDPESQYSGAIAAIQWKDEEPGALAKFLFKEYKIHSVGIEWENIHAVRITPHVYTQTRELDILVNGLQRYAK